MTLLRAYESRNVTSIEANGSWPIVWERARGVHVWDADGKKYLDMTAAFGVAATGHANPEVVRAGQQQMATLLHAMGDVHPHALKAQLARELSRITFERWRAKPVNSARPVRVAAGKTTFCNSGFEAVEAALKTALRATGKPGVVAFEGAYHGLGYGALNVTQRAHFRLPFRSQLREFGHFVMFPKSGAAHPDSAMRTTESQIRRLFRSKRIGAILVEPIQVRGGVNFPPPGFLPLLRRLCDEHQALLILDEIYTGFGRTGKWFACEHSGTVPDLICLGKALTGGFPLSACVGRADLMDAAWPPSSGEAIHTSTFLGHPVGCAMALAQIKQIAARQLVHRSASLGNLLLASLSSLARRPSSLALAPRGMGLLAGLEVCSSDGAPATAPVLKAVKALLRRGFIFLPEGEHSNVIGFTPPLTISANQLRQAIHALGVVLTA
ncbi:MAG TPA: aspartate aminotransferase family protein [Candidatus Paceibacterota bacterium]|nr:aspartate aminotransferase family protein [Candidatus Paceibacterota bacterium]